MVQPRTLPMRDPSQKSYSNHDLKICECGDERRRIAIEDPEMKDPQHSPALWSLVADQIDPPLYQRELLKHPANHPAA